MEAPENTFFSRDSLLLQGGLLEEEIEMEDQIRA